MLKTIDKINFKDKKVLVRVDFNVPIDKKGNILDDFRIKSFIPTLNNLIKKKPKQIILMCHLDPWKDTPAIKKDYRLKTDIVAKRLHKLTKQNIKKVDACIDIKLPDEQIILLENLRFYKGEKDNDKAFAKKLAKHADIYINDAFGTMHREHASIYAITKYFKTKGIGSIVERELKVLTPLLKNPKKPFNIILGGAKIKDKIKIINALAKHANKIFVGGKMALAFSYVEYIPKEEKDLAKNIVKKFAGKIAIPLDYVLENKKVVKSDEIPSGKKVFDIGPKTVSLWKTELKKSKTLFWNGPLGYYEKKPFDKSTDDIAKYLGNLKANTIIGGGDIDSALRIQKLDKKMSHMSTGGGATLKLLEGSKLAGLKALS